MRVEGPLPTEEPERQLFAFLIPAPFESGSGSVGGPSGAFAVQGSTAVTGQWYGAADGPGVQVTGTLFVGATYIRDPAELKTPFGKATYNIKLPGGTLEIWANAERALNPGAVGGVGFVPNGNNQLQIMGGTGKFEGISGVAVVNPAGSLAVAIDGEGSYLDGLNNITLYQDVKYLGKAVAVAVGVDPVTGKPLSFQGSGTSSSAHSQKHANELAGVEAQGAAATALNVVLALLNQTRV